MKADYRKSEEFLAQTIYKEVIDENILPEGEMLLLQPILPENTLLEGVMMGQVQNHKILVSLTDFANILKLNIKVDKEKQTASGWYIRQNKDFFVDVKNKFAQTDQGRFELSDDVVVTENDILVPIIELGQWIDFKFKPIISSQELKIEPSQSLPLQDRMRRREMDFKTRRVPPASLPLKETPYESFSVPNIDVSANSDYRKNGGSQEATKRADVNIRSVGDFAKGSLTTQTNINSDDKLRNMRVLYERETPDPELLGKLKARKVQLGDVTSVYTGLGAGIAQELGVRITNADPLKTYSKPTTAISGYAFPGWDVELYRDTQLLGFKETDENGYYNFENVSLYASDNNFRLVFNGPQGEMHEENLFIPIDQTRLSNSKGAYDVSLTFDGTQFYRKSGTVAEDEDKGAPNLSMMYEIPVFKNSALSAGFRSSEQEGERNNVLSAGLSTTMAEALVNIEAAVDDEGEGSAELTARRSFGQHDVNNVLRWTAPHFDTSNGGDQNEIGEITDTLRFIGPLPTPEFMQREMRYNASFGYTQDSDGGSSVSASGGISAAVKNVSLNQQANYFESDASEAAIINLTSVASVNFGKNNFRLQSNYAIKPDSQLNSVLANYRRRISNSVELNLEAQKRYLDSLTEFSAKLDWQAGFARISPRVSYNTEKDFYLGLSTRFGLLKDPRDQKIKFFDKSITGTGGASVFVFLDANGNGVFDEKEERLKDVVVIAPQNGGRVMTDEDGVALFTKMQELVRTDITLDSDTLQDPTWVPGFKGASIRPRSGYIATLDFPVHISGELDGTIYLGEQSQEAQSPADIEAAGAVPLRNISVSLYNSDGEAEQTVITDSGGFYYFSAVPPGRYFLIIDESSAEVGNFIRPLPQEIEIGYDGTVIYGRDLFVQGGKDVPSEVKANVDDLKAMYPDLDFNQDYQFVMNLGDYHSQLALSLVWYKMRTRYSPILSNAEIFVPPSKSIPAAKTGKHTLRIGLVSSDIQDAYKRCRSMIARNQYCKVEIYPKYMKQAALSEKLLTEELDQVISSVSD